MPANKPTTMLPRLASWLHAGGEPIVYYSLRLVDGARLPYTRRMLDAKALSSSVSILSLTECKELPTAAGY